jgi:hypothetical protein
MAVAHGATAPAWEEAMVPGGGFEPPTRGFSIRAIAKNIKTRCAKQGRIRFCIIKVLCERRKTSGGRKSAVRRPPLATLRTQIRERQGERPRLVGTLQLRLTVNAE